MQQSANLLNTRVSENDLRGTRHSAAKERDVTRTSALGSHSPFESFFNVGGLKLNDEDDPDLLRPRRRNTLPSVVLNAQEAKALAARLNERIDHPQPHHGVLRDSSKRKSRSAGALRDLAQQQQMTEHLQKDKTERITYWRNSSSGLDAGFASSIVPSEDVAQGTVKSAGVARSTGSTRKFANTDEDSQPFDFGLVTGSNDDSATLSQRVTTLEIKLVDLEYAIAKIQGFNGARPVAMRPALRNISPNAFDRQKSTNSANTLKISQRESSSPDQRQVSSDVTEQRDSRATLRPPPSARKASLSPQLTPSSPSAAFTSEQFDALLTLIKKEQIARQRLERQVAALYSEINDLRKNSPPRFSPASYPTPSPDSQESPTAMRGQARNTFDMNRLHFGSVSAETSRFSQSTQNDDSETDTEDGFLEAYETPTESKSTKFSMESARSVPPIGMF